MNPARRLCIAADIKGWSDRKVPEQIRAQQALATVIRAACTAARLPQEIAQVSGDGVLLLAPTDIDESFVIPAFVQGLTVALAQENRLLAAGAQIRLRLSLTNGMVTGGQTGFNGPALIEAFRLLNSPPVRKALEDYPNAQLALIVSDHLYRDVVQHDFAALRSADFWPVHSAMPDKRFFANAWVYVSDRTAGPVPPAGPAGSSDPVPAPDAEAARDGFEQADALSAAGDHAAAVEVLEKLLREQPEPGSPGALLRLGRAHDRLGNTQSARHTWKYLLESRPGAEVCLELGRLERREGNPELAQAHLIQGLGMARREKEPLEALVDELLALLSPDH